LIGLGYRQARSVPRVGRERAGVVAGLLVLLGR
jgi:hypothetical protein